MYGYVVVNKPELKFREFDMYRSYYCGLCDILKDKYGFSGQMSISYDMTFLILLLSGLYEPETKFYKSRCIAHPMAKHQVRTNDVTAYVADMNVLMTYYKCVDDWIDEKKITRKVMSDTLKRSVRKVIDKYPQKAQLIKNELEALSDDEKNNETNIDKVSSHFANIMASMTAIKDDEWKSTLERMGFHLGKFIYLLDAYEDLEGDLKAGRYNVFSTHADIDSFEGVEAFSSFCESILNTIMAECARCFEMLPILQDVDILRNIIYSGVWTRFEVVRSKSRKRQEKEN